MIGNNTDGGWADFVAVPSINTVKLKKAEKLGARAVNAAHGDPVEQIREYMNGRSVDVTLELIGLKATIEQAVSCLANMGRAAVARIFREPIAVDTYSQIVGKEGELIGVSDHLLSEIPALLNFAARGKINYSGIITKTIALHAAEINPVLTHLNAYADGARTVITP